MFSHHGDVERWTSVKGEVKACNCLFPGTVIGTCTHPIEKGCLLLCFALSWSPPFLNKSNLYLEVEENVVLIQTKATNQKQEKLVF